jgi:hypothetical protein
MYLHFHAFLCGCSEPAVAKTQVSAPPATPSSGSQEGQGAAPDGGPIKATPPMWRCSRIMQLQRDLHPTILLSLEGIVDNVSRLYSLFLSRVSSSAL